MVLKIGVYYLHKSIKTCINEWCTVDIRDDLTVGIFSSFVKEQERYNVHGSRLRPCLIHE